MIIVVKRKKNQQKNDKNILQCIITKNQCSKQTQLEFRGIIFFEIVSLFVLLLWCGWTNTTLEGDKIKPLPNKTRV